MLETAAGRVAKNSLWVTASLVVTKALSLVLMVFVARYLGDEGFGKYNLVFSLLSFLAVITTFGLDTIIIKEVARDRSKSGYYLVNSAYVRMLLCFASWGILLLLVPLLNKGTAVNLGLFIVGFSLLPTFFIASFRSVLLAHEMMSYTALLEILFRALVVGLGFMVLFLDLGLTSLFLTYPAAGVIMMPLWVRMYLKRVGDIDSQPDFTFTKKLVQQGVPFALAGLFVSMYYRMDTVLLSLMKGDEVVGWYNAAFGLVESLLFVSTAICTALFPVLSRLYGDTGGAFQKAYQKSFKFLFFCQSP